MKNKYFFETLGDSITPKIVEFGDKYVECLFKEPFEDGKLTLQSRVILEKIGKGRFEPLYLFTIIRCGNMTAGNKCSRLSNRFGARYSFEEDILNYLKNHNSSSPTHFVLDPNIIDNHNGTYTYHKNITIEEANAMVQLMVVCDPKSKSIINYSANLLDTDHDKGINTNVDYTKSLSISKEELIKAAKEVFNALEEQEISKNLDNISYTVSRIYKSQLIDSSIMNIKMELE